MSDQVMAAAPIYKNMLPIDDLQLDETEVLVVLLPLEAELAPTLRKILDVSELERADRALQAVHGERFTVARAGLRLVLSLLCGCGPRDIGFQVGTFGKLCLNRVSSSFQFNLSHGENLALIGLTRVSDAGIGVEKVRPVGCTMLAKLCFKPREQEELALWRGNDQLQAF